MAAKSPAVQKIFAEVKPSILTTMAKNESKPVLKGISATKKATNPKNFVPPKPRVQTPKKVVVKPAAKPVPVNNNIPAGWEISPGKIDRNGNPVLRQIRNRQFGGYYFM
jgi:hypothetical protein